MNSRRFFVPVLSAAIALTAFIGSIAIGEETKEGAPTDVPEFKLPPGWTEADLQACIVAGTPGKMQQVLAADAGVWKGDSTMWMYPGAEPVSTQVRCIVRVIMDGRYTQSRYIGEIPGMGPYNGLGLSGYDNVAKKFTCTWIDNHSTGMMTGEGKLSKDGKTLTWIYTYNCPINNKPATMRQIETTDGDSKKIEMFGADPKSGKEIKMMSIELTRAKAATEGKTKASKAVQEPSLEDRAAD